MYAKGDHVVYGKVGVCLIKDVGYPDVPGLLQNKQYYTLEPVFQKETIFTPVDTSVFMRYVLTKEEALKIIDQIPEIENSTEMPFDADQKALPKYYSSLMNNNDISDLIRLIIIIYAKSKDAEKNRKKLSQTDKNAMKNAEDLLYSELSIALGMEKDQIPGFIRERIKMITENR